MCRCWGGPAAGAGAPPQQSLLIHFLYRLAWSFSLFLLPPNCKSSSPSLPKWWEYGKDTTIARLSLLGKPIYYAKLIEASPYYEDSLGYTFRYPVPLGGQLWVEYYAPYGRISTIALLWESDSFPRMTEMYQLLRTMYGQLYGTPRGEVGNLEWRVGDTMRVVLRLSPERRYLHAAFALLSPNENLHTLR
ncbi:MAG: hypothetical protein RMJ57_01725 [Bacteroidia bacterium]|nr:hypothetical protein [Bacteroidia bacterium]